VERSKEILLYLEEEKISEEALARKLKKKGRSTHLKPLPLFKELEGDVDQSTQQKKVTKDPSYHLVTTFKHPLLEEIKKLKIDEMTPLEALNTLHLLKDKITSSSTSKHGF